MKTIPLPLANGITIYGREGCPYCDRAKDMVSKAKAKHLYVEKSLFSGFDEHIRPLIGDHRTVPVVFVDGAFLGGSTDLAQKLTTYQAALAVGSKKRRPLKKIKPKTNPRCAAIVRSGRRCSRRAKKTGRCCTQHHDQCK